MAGPAEMKEMVKESELFIKFFDKFLVKTVTISEITDQSIHQVISSISDVTSTESEEIKLINQFEEMICDSKKIDLIVFGINEIELMLDDGELEEIYVSDNYVHKEKIIKTNAKTIIHVIKSKEFTSKYGDLVGIRYYALFNDEYVNNDDIVEV